MSPSGSSDHLRKPSRARSAKPSKGAGVPRAGKGRTPSSSSRTRTGSDQRASRAAARQLRTLDATSSASRGSSAGRASAVASPRGDGRTGSASDGLSGLSEQLVDRILKPLGLIVLSRERIAEAVDEAAARGRLTRSDAELLIAELVDRGRQQTEDLLGDLDRTLGRGRQQLDVATRRARIATPDRLMRGADRARRTIGVGPSFPILGYDDLTVPQVTRRLSHLSDPELRTIRDYERRNANRKSLLRAIEKAFG
jgi:polyhydroxyalkanoate synthesis regulator phasin